MARKTARRSLRLENYSDRELLALVVDHEDGEGWADSLYIAEQIWPKYAAEEPRHARASVARRFSWLKSWGVMEHGKENGLWRLTEQGRQIVEGRLSAAQQEQVTTLEEAELMHFGYALAARYLRAEEVPAILLRRAMQFAQLRRRRG